MREALKHLDIKRIGDPTLKIGQAIIMYNDELPTSWDGSEGVIESKSNSNSCWNIRITKGIWQVGCLKEVHVDYLFEKFIPKPHVYSPVFMTGRYRTVGD